MQLKLHLNSHLRRAILAATIRGTKSVLRG